jgi:hypothetical protein
MIPLFQSRRLQAKTAGLALPSVLLSNIVVYWIKIGTMFGDQAQGEVYPHLRLRSQEEILYSLDDLEKNSPSRRDGITLEQELLMKREAINQIIVVGLKLNM